VTRRDRLRAALGAHVVGDGQEARAMSAMLDALAGEPDPFDRATYPAHVTGSALVLASDADAALLVWHRKLQRWLQPGGHVHADDASTLATAMREAREETGIEAFEAPEGGRILDLDAHEIPARGAEPAHVHLDVRYLLTTSRLTPVAHDAAEVEAAAWFERAALDALDLDASLRRALARAWRLRDGRTPSGHP
jgi:8-oxo-dGTP pyrophosphatase MutT (NUDIX family)